MNSPSTQANGSDAAVLEARGLRKIFSLPTGPLEVLAGVDLALAAGESISIRGESGSGKSTLLHLLGGLEQVDGGEVCWGGQAIQSWTARRLARWRSSYLGFVFQAYHLVPELSALDNVLLAARLAGRVSPATRNRARDLLGRVGLGERHSQLPIKMSGGERQRVALARALINQPRLLLADEPTGNLDERTAAGMMDLLLGLTREEGVAMVLVTHSPEFAALTQRQAHLHLGRLSGEVPQ